MGQLVDGIWQDQWYDTASPAGPSAAPTLGFRNWITADGSAGPSGERGFQAEPGRYHLYVSLACPWAHRTLIFRKLKGLEELIGVSVVHPDMLADGWTFATDRAGTTGDRLYGAAVPARHLPQGRSEGLGPGDGAGALGPASGETIVSNESSEIIRMFNSAFDGLTGNADDYWPADLRAAIEPVNARIYDTLNNGVYKAGFATTQAAYDAAVHPLFDTLDWLEARLSASRWLMGERLTEADWRLFTTLVRFDAVYHGHFKCNRRRIVDYARALGLHPGALPVARRRRDGEFRPHHPALLLQPRLGEPAPHRADRPGDRLAGADAAIGPPGRLPATPPPGAAAASGPERRSRRSPPRIGGEEGVEMRVRPDHLLVHVERAVDLDLHHMLAARRPAVILRHVGAGEGRVAADPQPGAAERLLDRPPSCRERSEAPNRSPSTTSGRGSPAWAKFSIASCGIEWQSIRIAWPKSSHGSGPAARASQA